MENSPSVEILAVTADANKAKEEYEKAKKKELEWIKEQPHDSGNWASACMVKKNIKGKIQPGKNIFLAIEIEWFEEINCKLETFSKKEKAQQWAESRKKERQEEDPDLVPFDGNDDNHLCNDSLISDYYFKIEKHILK